MPPDGVTSRHRLPGHCRYSSNVCDRPFGGLTNRAWPGKSETHHRPGANPYKTGMPARFAAPPPAAASPESVDRTPRIQLRRVPVSEAFIGRFVASPAAVIRPSPPIRCTATDPQPLSLHARRPGSTGHPEQTSCGQSPEYCAAIVALALPGAVLPKQNATTMTRAAIIHCCAKYRCNNKSGPRESNCNGNCTCNGSRRKNRIPQTMTDSAIASSIFRIVTETSAIVRRPTAGIGTTAGTHVGAGAKIQCGRNSGRSGYQDDFALRTECFRNVTRLAGLQRVFCYVRQALGAVLPAARDANQGLVPAEGFEPPTPSLRMMCSTN